MPCGDPAPDCAIGDVAIVRGLLEADQFRVSPFPAVIAEECGFRGHGETALRIPGCPTDYSILAFHAPAFTLCGHKITRRDSRLRSPNAFRALSSAHGNEIGAPGCPGVTPSISAAILLIWSYLY